MKLSTLIALTLTTFSLTTSGSHAHETYNCFFGGKLKWPTARLDLHADSVSFPPGNTFTNRLFDTANAWHAAGSKFRYTVLLGATRTGDGNKRSEIWFESGLDPETTGQTTLWRNTFTCSVSEADVKFNSNLPFTTSTRADRLRVYRDDETSALLFQATAIHEFGHAQCLRHEADVYNVMGIANTFLQTNGNTARAYVGEDAATGSIHLYGTASSARTDLSVSHWRRSGTFSAPGEDTYSRHDRTSIFQNGRVVDNDESKDPTFTVRAGQSYDVPFTYEVTGRPGFQTHVVKVKFYLSANSTISTGDVYVGSRTIGMRVNTPYSSSTRLRIPISRLVPTGRTYWLGAIIDPDREHAEFDEGNNATWIRVRVER